MEEEVASTERVAESQTKVLVLQPEQRVLILKLEGIQAELQRHQCNHAGSIGSTQRGVLLRQSWNKNQKIEELSPYAR